MRRLTLLALLLALPAPAHAIGYGSSYGLGLETSSRGYYVSPFGLYPSLDLHLAPAWLQLYPLELVQGITIDELWIGGAGWAPGWSYGTGTVMEGVLMPGASFDLVADTDFKPLYLAVCATGRLGLPAQESMGFGAYILPSAGLALADGDFEVMLGGRMEFSLWLR